MIAESTDSRGSLMGWLVAPLAALVIYIGTWPVVEMKTTKVTSTYTTWTSGGAFYQQQGVQIEASPWSASIYAPMHSVCRIYPEKNPLVAYWRWWSRKLDFRGFPMLELDSIASP